MSRSDRPEIPARTRAARPLASRRRSPGRLRRVSPAAAAISAVALLAAACGGGATPAGVASLGTTTVPAHAGSTAPPAGANASSGPSGGSGHAGSALAFARCMQTNGVPDFPDPSGGKTIISSRSGINPSSPQFQAAQQKCQSLEPGGGPPSATQLQQMLAAALEFSQCMRAHGLADFPDPQVGNGGIGIRINLGAGGGSALDPRSPVFQAAQKACDKLLPFGGKVRRVSSNGSGPASARSSG